MCIRKNYCNWKYYFWFLATLRDLPQNETAWSARHLLKRASLRIFSPLPKEIIVAHSDSTPDHQTSWLDLLIISIHCILALACAGRVFPKITCAYVRVNTIHSRQRLPDGQSESFATSAWSRDSSSVRHKKRSFLCVCWRVLAVSACRTGSGRKAHIESVAYSHNRSRSQKCIVLIQDIATSYYAQVVTIWTRFIQDTKHVFRKSNFNRYLKSRTLKYVIRIVWGFDD